MRHIKLFAILIAMLVTIFSCQKSDEFSIDSVAQTLTAYAPGSGNEDETPDTKVDFTELASGNIELDWQVNDVITIYSSSKRVGNWKVNSVDSDGKASFVKVDGDNLTNGVDYTAVYPASTAATIADWDNEKIYSTSPADETKWQTQTGNDDMSHLDDKLRMKTQPFSSTETMNFAHQASIMTIIFNTPNVLQNVGLADDYNKTERRYYITKLNEVSQGDYKVHLMISPNSSTSHKIAFELLRNIEVEKTITTAFVAGKHYVLNTLVTEPVGFPSGAVPVVSMQVPNNRIMTEIPSDGLLVDDKYKDQIESSTFFIGYNKSGTGLTTRYKVFDDVTWSTSENVYPFINRNPYLSITRNDNGSIELELLRELPTTKKTITITATAPNKKKMSFDIHLCKDKPAEDAPTSVSLDRNIFVANIGAAMTLSSTVLPDESSINKTLNWSSSNPSVATVDASGKVTTKGAGSTIITATAVSGGKSANCTVRVNTAEATGLYKIGDYYPNATNPIGVVFMTNTSNVGGSVNSGKIIALDSYKGPFTSLTTDPREGVDRSNGYNNIRACYVTDKDFSDYPAYKWVAEKNAVGYTYPAGAKGQWYLASDEELRHLMAGMCGFIMIGCNAALHDGYINDWSVSFPMSRDGKSYTPDLTSFNKKITDKGGVAISGNVILGSTINSNAIYCLDSQTGMVSGKGKTFADAKVRAIMAF